MASSAGEEMLRNLPWGDVQDVDAQDCDEGDLKTAAVDGPAGIQQINAQRLAQIGKL